MDDPILVCRFDGLGDLVFPSTDRTVLDGANVRKALSAIITTAEVRRCRRLIHVLRHTSAAHMLQAAHRSSSSAIS